MRRGMEKERLWDWTLFGRLLAFWQGMEPQEENQSGIGFWQRMRGYLYRDREEADGVNGQSFQREKQEVLLKQNEKTESIDNKTFWQKKIADAEDVQRRNTFVQEKQMFLEEKGKTDAAFAEGQLGKNNDRISGEMITEVSSVQPKPRREAEKKALLWGMERSEPENAVGISFWNTEALQEDRKRQILPLLEKTKKQDIPILLKDANKTAETAGITEDEKTESTIDIDRLMRQFAQRLWEEREGCGRRRYR